MTDVETAPPKLRPWVRVAPALGLLILAPICAEYLYGYDDSTGNPAALLGGLVLFAPLYGGAALLIRELARRAGRGWPTILLLGLAFGVLQAGLIDQSMFNPSYRDIDYWDEMFNPTYVSWLGFSPELGVMFTTGHLIWSVAVPIAIIEALVPRRRTTPWLRWPGLALTAVGFGLAAYVVVWWTLDTEDFVPSAGQLLGAAMVVIALVVAAFVVRPRHRLTSNRPSPSPWLVGTAAFAALAFRMPVQGGWTAFAVNLGLLAGLLAVIVWWSARPTWGPLHQLALAGGALLANVATAFLGQPIGDVSTTAKYGHNVVALIAVAALLTCATLRTAKEVRG
jgi:hypothetical protein